MRLSTRGLETFRREPPMIIYCRIFLGHLARVFESNANDLSELAVHGFGVADIAESLRWLRTLRTLSLPEPHHLLGNLGQIVDHLLGTTEQSMMSEGNSDCKILANQDDIEAVATAHVLRHLLAPHILHLFSILPVVLDVRKSTSRLTMTASHQAASTMLLMVCTRECLTSPCMVKWLLQANHVASSCCVLPIVGDEDFLVPTSSAAFQRLGEHPDLQDSDHARDDDLGTSIAVHFWPKSYSESALGLKAAQMAQRLQGEQSATLSSLLDACHAPQDMSWFTSQKSVLLETVEELSPVAASTGKEEGNHLKEAVEALEAEDPLGTLETNRLPTALEVGRQGYYEMETPSKKKWLKQRSPEDSFPPTR
eukprot:s2867_g8.t1